MIKIKFKVDTVMNNGGYKFLTGKIYNAVEDGDFYLITIPRKGRAKAPKTAEGSIFEVIKSE